MKFTKFETRKKTAMKNTQFRTFESLESRRLLTIYQAGDANRDFYFDEADIIEVFKSGKFETDRDASWAEGDWDGMFSPEGLRSMFANGSYNPFQTPEGNGRFDSDDLEYALESGRYRAGTYLVYVSSLPSHSRSNLLPTTDDADVQITYDGSNGDVSIEGSDTIFSTIHLHSDLGIFTGVDGSDDLGGFEVNGSSGSRSDFLLLDPTGTSSRSYQSLAMPGLTLDVLLEDLTVDGSRLAGGGLGRVSISCVNCEEEASLLGDFNNDMQLTIEDIDALSMAIFNGTHSEEFDLNNDDRVDLLDLGILVEDILNTNFGDANLDGKVDTTDLLIVFIAAEYEDGIDLNSTWATGDWNADREFDSVDLVIALLTNEFGG